MISEKTVLASEGKHIGQAALLEVKAVKICSYGVTELRRRTLCVCVCGWVFVSVVLIQGPTL